MPAAASKSAYLSGQEDLVDSADIVEAGCAHAAYSFSKMKRYLAS